MAPAADDRALLILDYDGTLCNTRSAILEALGRTFDTRSLPRPADEAILSLVGSGITIAQTIRRLHPDSLGLPENELAAMVAEYRRQYEHLSPEHVELFSGVRETLEQLRGIATVVIASNKGAAAVRSSLERFDLLDAVSVIVADERGLPLKPDPRVFQERIAQHFTWARPQRTFVLGDTEIDLRFAVAAGLIGCWAAYGYGHPQRCAEVGYRHRIESFSDLLPIISVANR